MRLILKDVYGQPGKVVVTAHRGFSGKYPENTLAAFRAAEALGADILEFDLRGTKDGVPIVLHDRTFERTANQPGKPGDYTLSEIRGFTASYWEGAHDTGVRRAEPTASDVRIPTFEDVLNGVGEGVGLNIQVYDTTPPVLAEIARLYRAHDLYDRAYLTMATYRDGERVRSLDARIALCVNESHGRMNEQALREQQAFGCRYVQPYTNDVSPEFCRRAKALGLCVNLFCSNTDDDNRRYIAMGVPGILTDWPDILQNTLRSLGRL